MLTSRRVNAVLAAGYRAFVDELRKLGFSEGQSVIFDQREINQDVTGLYASAAELARADPDVIVTSGPEVALQAAIAASSTIPIVMLAINYDPIARGYIKNLAQPGGNVSGVFLRQTESVEKQVELLTQAFPERKCVGIIWDRASVDQFTAAERRAKALGLEVRSLEMEKPP
jgi:putative ABC transport system substrate-binding protein